MHSPTLITYYRVEFFVFLIERTCSFDILLKNYAVHNTHISVTLVVEIQDQGLTGRKPISPLQFIIFRLTVLHYLQKVILISIFFR